MRLSKTAGQEVGPLGVYWTNRLRVTEMFDFPRATRPNTGRSGRTPAEFTPRLWFAESNKPFKVFKSTV